MEYTKFTGISADEVKSGSVIGPARAAVISKAANYSLADEEKCLYIGCTMTAASKTLTLGMAEGAVCVVVNEGSNTFTLKNVSGDSGTSVAAGKAYLVRASATANGSVVTLLNDGT